jgi:hypothetical protein
VHCGRDAGVQEAGALAIAAYSRINWRSTPASDRLSVRISGAFPFHGSRRIAFMYASIPAAIDLKPPKSSSERVSSMIQLQGISPRFRRSVRASTRFWSARRAPVECFEITPAATNS